MPWLQLFSKLVTVSSLLTGFSSCCLATESEISDAAVYHVKKHRPHHRVVAQHHRRPPSKNNKRHVVSHLQHSSHLPSRHTTLLEKHSSTKQPFLNSRSAAAHTLHQAHLHFGKKHNRKSGDELLTVAADKIGKHTPLGTYYVDLRCAGAQKTHQWMANMKVDPEKANCYVASRSRCTVLVASKRDIKMGEPLILSEALVQQEFVPTKEELAISNPEKHGKKGLQKRARFQRKVKRPSQDEGVLTNDAYDDDSKRITVRKVANLRKKLPPFKTGMRKGRSALVASRAPLKEKDVSSEESDSNSENSLEASNNAKKTLDSSAENSKLFEASAKKEIEAELDRGSRAEDEKSDSSGSGNKAAAAESAADNSGSGKKVEYVESDSESENDVVPIKKMTKKRRTTGWTSEAQSLSEALASDDELQGKEPDTTTIEEASASSENAEDSEKNSGSNAESEEGGEPSRAVAAEQTLQDELEMGDDELEP